MKATRRVVQLAFLVLTLVGVFAIQGHTERWCPFGGVEALYMYYTQGNLTCSLGVSNFYILGGVLLLALLARRAFCGYACPIGAVSEWLRAVGRRLGVREVRVSYGLDRALALLKYPVLAVILYFTWRAGELIFRGFDPCYALISRHGEDITFWAYTVSGLILLASLAVVVPFCRWLCPLAAVFTPFSRFGFARITRNAVGCIDCGLCARACPMGIQVDQAQQVTAARCTSCLDCLVACPKIAGKKTLIAGDPPALTWGPPKIIGGRWPQAVAIALLLLCIGGAVAATYAFPLPSFISTRGEASAKTDSLRMIVRGPKCRESAEQFVKYISRRDEYKIRGYLRVEVWPTPSWAPVRIVFDPVQTDAATIKQAITEPLFDPDTRAWRFSPYEIQGYDPLAAER